MVILIEVPVQEVECLVANGSISIGNFMRIAAFCQRIIA